MAQILSGSICLSDIDKSKIVKGKNGKAYLNVSVFINNDYRYNNNAGICLSQSKEEREAKEPKAFIGNAKTVWSDGQQATPEQAEQTNTTAPATDNVGDDLPF